MKQVASSLDGSTVKNIYVVLCCCESAGASRSEAAAMRLANSLKCREVEVLYLPLTEWDRRFEPDFHHRYLSPLVSQWVADCEMSDLSSNIRPRRVDLRRDSHTNGVPPFQPGEHREVPEQELLGQQLDPTTERPFSPERGEGPFLCLKPSGVKVAFGLTRGPRARNTRVHPAFLARGLRT